MAHVTEIMNGIIMAEAHALQNYPSEPHLYHRPGCELGQKLLDLLLEALDVAVAERGI